MADVPHVKRWIRRPEGSNWGDFGPDDQVGRLNMITPEMRRAAVGEVKEGLCFALSLPLDCPGGEPATTRQPPKLSAVGPAEAPAYHLPVGRLVINDDHLEMSLQYSTQWDSLAHIGVMFDVDGSGEKIPVYYNGWRAGTATIGPDVDKPPCACQLGIENMAMTGVQGRGVLFDLARAFGIERRTRVGYDELMRVIEEQRIEVRPGDFLLFYTGWADRLLAMGDRPDWGVLDTTGAALDGSDQRLLDWITESGVVALIADNPTVEHYDPGQDVASHEFLALHEHCIFKLGIHLGEFFWLKDLAGHLRASGRSAFLFTGPPLRLPGAVGSPVTAVATV